jgi:hypothetical protein
MATAPPSGARPVTSGRVIIVAYVMDGQQKTELDVNVFS